MHWNTACDHAGLENQMYLGLYTCNTHSSTASFSSNTQSSTALPLCFLRCAKGTTSLCRARTQAWPISTIYAFGWERQGITAQCSK